MRHWPNFHKVWSTHTPAAVHVAFSLVSLKREAISEILILVLVYCSLLPLQPLLLFTLFCPPLILFLWVFPFAGMRPDPAGDLPELQPFADTLWRCLQPL